MGEDPRTGACPACRDVDLQPRSTLGIEHRGCPGCGGVFIGFPQLTDYVAQVTENPDAAVAFKSILRRSLLEDEEDGARLRHCHACGLHLERFGFGEHPFAIVDQCREHGLWLDDGDLSKLVRQARASARLSRESWNEGDREEPRPRETRSYTSSDVGELVCPNCGRGYPSTDRDKRCDDCNVVLYLRG